VGRFLATGVADPSFGSGGLVAIPVSGNVFLTAGGVGLVGEHRFAAAALVPVSASATELLVYQGWQ
jgi:hypothetical protein